MEARFFGHTWTPQGVRPDSSKVAAIQRMLAPEDIKSLESFLGLVNYLARYSARLATITASRSELMEKEAAYIWGPEHDFSFSAIKQEVSTHSVLRYFHPAEEIAIQTVASLKCLSAVLLQNGQSVC